MAECEWLILCDYAFLAEGRKLCLVGMFDRIFASAVPAKHHQAALAFLLIGEPKETVALKIEIVRPTGASLLSLGAHGQLGETGTLRGHVALNDLTLPDFGNYALQVLSGETLLKTATFAVQLTPSPQKPEGSG